jgi:hypothetical protein
MELLVGFELEFILLKPSGKDSAVAGWEPVDQSVYCQSSSLNAVAHGELEHKAWRRPGVTSIIHDLSYNTT